MIRADAFILDGGRRMSSGIDETMLKAMLQALEHVLDSVDSAAARASRKGR